MRSNVLFSTIVMTLSASYSATAQPALSVEEEQAAADATLPDQGVFVARVHPDGSVHVVAEGMWTPNGMAITQDGGTLLVGETLGNRITAYPPRAFNAKRTASIRLPAAISVPTNPRAPRCWPSSTSSISTH